MGTIIQNRIKYGEGKDGFSPIVNTKEIENGYRVDIRDAQGNHTFDILNGADGIDAPCDGLMFTSLEELRLTAPVSIGEVFNAMPDKTMLMLNVNNAANEDATVTDAPHNQGILIINKHNSGRFSIEFNYSLGGNGNTIRKWIGTLKGSDGTGLNWKEVAYLNDHAMKSYSSLADLELDTTATINDIVGKMANTSMFVYKTDVFDYATEYNNIQYGTVTIIKQSANRVQAIMTDKDTGDLYIGYMNSANKFVGWNKNIKNSKGLVSNAQNFKIDLTKNNSSWYGFFTFSFTYGTTPCEITVAITDKVYYTITKGLNLVSALTYTQSDANYTIGIDLTAKVYGTQVVDMPSEFGVINSLTAETFAGTTAAVLKGYDVRTVTTLAELGLTSSATVDDVHNKLAVGQMAILSVQAFDNYQTLFPYTDSNDQYARLEIQKGESVAHSRIFWFRKDGSRLAIGHIDASNKLGGWLEYALKSYVDSKIADLQAQINALK